MFTPTLRYFSLASYQYNYNIALFAIGDSIITSSKEMETLSNDNILAIARNTALASKQPLGIKKSEVNDFGELNYFTGIFDESDDRLLEYIDCECPEEYIIENLPENAQADNSDWQDLAPESSLQETIEWLASNDEIPMMAIWPIYAIENELTKYGYAHTEKNIDLIKKEIHELIGYDNDHRDFIFKMTFDRIKNNLEL